VWSIFQARAVIPPFTYDFQIPDGVAAIAIGKLGSMKDPVIIVGGNCSIQAFDHKGNEILWTVTGDNVRSIIVVDIDLDGFNEVNIITRLYFVLFISLVAITMKNT